MKPETDANVYMAVPLDRVCEDALHGVSLARQAWRQRDPKRAALALGAIVEPGQQHTDRVIQATAGFLAGKSKPETHRAEKQKAEQGQLW